MRQSQRSVSFHDTRTSLNVPVLIGHLQTLAGPCRRASCGQSLDVILNVHPIRVRVEVETRHCTRTAKDIMKWLH